MPIPFLLLPSTSGGGPAQRTFPQDPTWGWAPPPSHLQCRRQATSYHLPPPVGGDTSGGVRTLPTLPFMEPDVWLWPVAPDPAAPPPLIQVGHHSHGSMATVGGLLHTPHSPPRCLYSAGLEGGEEHTEQRQYMM